MGGTGKTSDRQQQHQNFFKKQEKPVSPLCLSKDYETECISLKLEKNEQTQLFCKKSESFIPNPGIVHGSTIEQMQ